VRVGEIKQLHPGFALGGCILLDAENSVRAIKLPEEFTVTSVSSFVR